MSDMESGFLRSLEFLINNSLAIGLSYFNGYIFENVHKFRQFSTNHKHLSAVATSTAQATVQPTIGLLPMPRNPIISTCAGTDEEPAN